MSWHVRGRPGLSAGGVVLTLLAPLAGRAAEPPRVFDVPEQAREDALLALAAQAGISLGFAEDARCPGRAGVRGRMTTAQALERLLAGSACAARQAGPRAVVIVARPAPPASAPPDAVPTIAAAPPVDVGELVVTAPKRKIRLREAPYALSVIPGEALATQGIGDPQELATLAAGVTVTNLGPGRDKILLRGLSDGPLTGHTQSTVGIYFDQLRLTYNAPDPDLRWTDIARVEVLRGPQGSLYGSGSVGGIVQVVPNAPDPTVRTGWVSATGEATAHGGPSAALEGVINQPLAGGRGALRLVGWSEVLGGYIDDVATGRDDVNRTRRNGGRAALLWAPHRALSLEASLISQSIYSRDTHYAEPAVGALARDNAYPEPHDNDFLAASLTARWRTRVTELTVTTGVIDHSVGSRYDASAAPASLSLPGAAPAVYDDQNEIRGFLTEARLASHGAGRLQWLAGVFTSDGRQRLNARLLDAAGRPGYAETRHDDLDESALFGEASYALTRHLTLTAGGRLFTSHLKTRSLVTLGDASRAFAGSTKHTGFAPKLVAAYRLGRGVSVYGEAAEGYRTRGFNTAGPIGQAFAAAAGQEQPLRRYGGDELWSYEGGLRWISTDGAARLRVAVFHAVWRDIQADLLLPSGLPFTANLGDGASTGLELEAARRLGPLTLSGNLSLQDPELRRLNPGFPSRPDSGLPGVPRRAFALLAAYQRPLNAGWSVELSSRFTYVGPSRLSFRADLAPRMGGYGDLRLAAALRSDRLRLAAWLDNAADSRRDTFAFGNPFSLPQQAQTTPQRPRTLGVSVTRSF